MHNNNSKSTCIILFEKQLPVQKHIENDTKSTSFTKEKTTVYESDDFKIYAIERQVVIDTRLEEKGREEVLLLEIETKNDSFIVSVPSKDLSEKKLFKQKLYSFSTDIKFNMKEKEFEELKNKINEIAPQRKIFASPGHQGDVYVFVNAIYNYANGILLYKEKSDLYNSINHSTNSLISTKNTYYNLLSETTKNPNKIAKELFNCIVNSYKDYSVLYCIAIAIATVFYDIFLEIAQGFPPVILSGKSQTGKSTLLYTISSLFGLTQSSNFTSGNSTPYAIAQELYSAKNVIIPIEELPQNIFPKLEELIKNVYSGLSRKRGKKDGLEKTPILTSFIATSNSFFENLTPQLLSRIAFVQMDENSFDASSFKYFSKESRDELSVILPLILKFRPYVPELYMGFYKTLSNNTSESNRLVSNLSIACTMWTIINKIVGIEIVDWKKLVVNCLTQFHNYQNLEVNSGDKIMNDITRLIELDKLFYNHEYKLIRSTILKLNLNRYISKYNIENPKAMMTTQKFKLIVANDERFNCENPQPVKDIGRAISIDISKEEYLLEKVTIQKGFMKTTRGDNNNED